MRTGVFQAAQSWAQWVADRVWNVEHAFERANAASQQAQNTRMRIFAIMVGLSVGFLTLAGFATRASLFSGLGRIADVAAEPNARAQLVDRNGQLLASDVNDYDMFVDPSNMTAPDRTYVRQALTRLFPDVTRAQFDKVFAGRSRVLLTGSIKEARRDAILNYGLPGVTFEGRRVREYPLANTGAVYIGMTQRGGIGLSGAEKALQEEIKTQAIHDQPVALAMDLRVQGALENELRAVAQEQRVQGAVGIVTNVRTGEVLAMASYPDFDLNHPGAVSEDVKRNRAAVDRYEVGSIFKVVSIAVGLDTGATDLNATYDGSAPFKLGSRLIHDEHSSSSLLTLTDVFIKSSNIGTSRVALAVGAQRMVSYYKSLSLLSHADIELGEPASPIVPQRWSDTEMVSSAFGQAMAITPLSFAEAAGAVLNGGCLRPLTIRKYDGQTPLACNRVLKPETSASMLELMRQNVIKGTGTRANAPGLRVGGKTGTAQKPVAGHYTLDNIASFDAVFPVDGPVDSDRYQVLIMYDSPQGAAGSNGSRQGGYVAAPVAGRLIDRIAPFLGVERKADKFSGPQWDKAPVLADDVTGSEH